MGRIREAARRLAPGPSPEWSAPLKERFFAALAEDFNTPGALAAVFDWVREANRAGGEAGEPGPAGDARGARRWRTCSSRRAPPRRPGGGARARRTSASGARERRDFAAADRLRDELRAAGWEVRDGPDGPELLPARVIVYGRNPVREALRGRRHGRARSGPRPPRRASRGWPGAGVPVRTVEAEEIERRAGSGGHQGVCAAVSPFRYARERRAAARRRPR